MCFVCLRIVDRESERFARMRMLGRSADGILGNVDRHSLSTDDDNPLHGNSSGLPFAPPVVDAGVGHAGTELLADQVERFLGRLEVDSPEIFTKHAQDQQL